MAGGDLTPAENAILIVLMAEAREVLNTELFAKYGLNVRKVNRDKLVSQRLVASRPSGRTTALQLDDKGWVHVQEELRFRSNGSTAQAAALSAVLNGLRDRGLERAGCTSLAELFALHEVRGQTSGLRARIVNAYEALTDEPGGWVSLTRMRPFFGDLSRTVVDEALRQLSREPGVTLAPQSNQKVLTDADHEAALHIGGQDKHVLAIG